MTQLKYCAVELVFKLTCFAKIHFNTMFQLNLSRDFLLKFSNLHFVMATYISYSPHVCYMSSQSRRSYYNRPKSTMLYTVRIQSKEFFVSCISCHFIS
jgi:cytochrome c oxidase assembly factor CtaG